MFDWVTKVLDAGGYAGVALLMLLENIFPPIPSELVMPFAGYAARQGEMDLVLVIVSGSIGSLLGALFWFHVGRWLGLERLRRFAARHGRWLTLSPGDVDRADRWFDRHGQWAVLFGRLIPAVRTLISVPAGVSGMSYRRFLIASTIGTIAWTALLAVAGYLLAGQYEIVQVWLNPVSNVVVGALILWYLYRVGTFGRRVEADARRQGAHAPAKGKAARAGVAVDLDAGAVWRAAATVSMRSPKPRMPVLKENSSARRILSLLRREAGILLILLFGAALVVAFGRLAESILEGDAEAFDTRLFMLFRQAGDPAAALGPAWLHAAARDVTALGSTTILAFATFAVAGYLLIQRRRGAALFVLAAVLGGQALTTLLKGGFDRARPDLVPHAAEVFTASFPSGHATLSAVTYLTLGALLAWTQPRSSLRLYILSLCVLLSIAIGVTRVYLGVHWPTDVLAGWSLGAAWALLCWAVALWLQRRGAIAWHAEEGPPARGETAERPPGNRGGTP